MKFSLIALSNALLFATAFAGVAERQQRRESRVRRTNPKIPATGNFTASIGRPYSNISNVSYSTNWAGAVLTAPPAGSTFTSVSATFVVPTPSGSGAASAWVGIDGDTYQNSILQTGVDFTVTGGRVTYDAWYEWYPDYAYDFTGITFRSGDTVSLSVTASSATAGTAVIENVTTGQTVSKAITSTSRLGGQNAEWIVEDFEQNGGMVEFANFGTVTFANAVAGYSGGGTETAAGAEIMDIKQNGQVLTSSSASGSSVTVKHN
ncbi:Aspergillopepsin-2, partial [Lachnellula suecica]